MTKSNKWPKGKICCNCRHWHQQRFSRHPMFDSGTCQRFPPFAMVMNFQAGAVDHIQPMTKGIRTCGEFKPRLKLKLP